MPFFWLGLVTGAWEINWEGSFTLSKKEKRNQSTSQKNANKVWKTLQICFLCCNLKKASFIYYSQFQNNVLNATESGSFRYFLVAYGAIICLVWRSQRGFAVSRPTVWQFTVNRQKTLYLTVDRQKRSLRLTVKKFLGVSNLTISADLDGIPAPNKEFLNWKNQFSCQKNTLSRQYSTLQPAYIWKYFEI